MTLTYEEYAAKRTADHERMKALLLKRSETDPELAELLLLMYHALRGQGFP